MSNASGDFGALSETEVDELAEAYAAGRYDECLRRACGLLLRTKDRGDVLLTFIHRSATHLLESGESGRAQSAMACSFCGKSPPEVRLGAGPSAFICNQCVATFSAILR